MYAELNSTCAEVISIRKRDGRIYFCNLGIDLICHAGVEKSDKKRYDISRGQAAPGWVEICALELLQGGIRL